MIRALAAVAVLVSGCSSIDQFDIELEQPGVLPGAISSITRTGLESWAAGAAASRQIDNQGVSAADLTSVRVKTATVAVTAPEGGHLKYLTKLELFISADGVPEKRLAVITDGFAETKSVYDFVLDDLELKAYVAAPSMKIRAVLAQRAKPSTDHELLIKLVLHVDLSVIQ